MAIRQKTAAKDYTPARNRSRVKPWIPWTVISAAVSLGILALATGTWRALSLPDDARANTSAAMYTLLDSGNVLEAEIGRTVRPAMDRTEILARSPELNAALSSGDRAIQTALLNSRITTATEIDAIALFDSAGRITAINTCYADGKPIPKERVNRVLGADFGQRQIIQGCLRNNSKSRILEFQTHCDITPAFFDSTGLSVAYSVPVIDPHSGAKIGVISSRLRFERLSGLIEGRTIAGGAARAYFITDAGGYFSEAISSGREQPPVPVAELREIVRPLLNDLASKTVISRADKFLAIFSLPDVQVLDGGGIHILIVADGHWLTRGPMQDRLVQAAGAGLIGTLLLIVAGLVHARVAARRARQTIEEAGEANARLAAIVESSTEAVISDNLDGTVRSWNQGAEKMFGFSAQEAVGRNADLIEPPDSPGEIAKLRRDVLEGASIEQFGTRRRRKDGREIDVSLSISLIRDAAGKTMGISRIARDITAQKHIERELHEAHAQLEVRVGQRTAELSEAVAALQQQMAERMQVQESLRESEERFRQLAENTNDVFWMMSATGDRVLYISPRYEQVWGHTCRELCDNPHGWMEAIEPVDRPSVENAWVASLAGREYSVEYRILRPDGAVRWIRDRALPIRDSEGKVYRIAGIAEDITARRIAEQQLKEAKDSAEAANHAKSVVFDTALDAIVTIDSRGLITAWNLQAETMFRWDRNEVAGMRLDQTIISERHWEAHRREIEAFIKTGDGPLLDKVVEIAAMRRDGREFPVEVAITPAWSGGECTFTAFIRDITMRKQAEVDLRQARDAAETASRAKSEFLAKMSHEIRTPLNGVIGMSSLLLDTSLDERQQRFVQLIKSSGESLSCLINDILDFSKIEARKLEIESVDFDLSSVVEDVTEIMSMKAAEKGLDLACLTMPDIPRRVKGDPQRIKQILVNVVNNAIKFTESGSISTRVTLDGQSPEHLMVRFSITDTGIGIPVDRMDRLFKSFSQVDSSTTRTHGGTGLGLAISKQLAELMGGRIGVESTPGHGSTFWFTVRLGPGVQAPEPVATATIDPRGLRVLAVHDSPMMRETLRSQLCGWGLEAATAPTGDEAMKMLINAAANARPYHVAILDGELPDINTLELGKAIKARSEIAQTVLLILLPADSDLEPSELAEFSGQLNKPVRQSLLYDSIVDAMDSVSGRKKSVAKIESIASGSLSHPVHTPQWARILVAEDNRVNQIVACEVLAKHGYACDIVDNGRKAVAAVSAGSYGLVLMDCSMPEMDGFEATRQIRLAENANPAKLPRHIPIIALTANAINGDRERCLEAGMDDYVSKPLDPARLIEAIQELLAKSSPIMPAQRVIVAAATTATPPSAIVRDEAPPVATDALLDRCMGDAATVALILDEFEIQAVTDLAEITRLVRSGDGAGTARVAHALKGASGILSATGLADIACKLEQMGRTGAIADEGPLLTQLNDEVRRCIDYLPVVRAAIAKSTEP